MNDRYLSRQYSVATAVMIALGVTPTLGAESRDELEEIVVTAQFREQNLQDTPIAITAVTAEMLELRSQNSIYQVAAQAPNVTLAPQGQGNGSGIIAFIRGVGQTDFNFALEPGVGLYIDDVYYSTLTGSLVDLTDLERVEVLRGPQGTLAGRNSIGGAVKLFSRKPSGEGGSVSLTYGKFNRIDARGMADFALAQDKVFMRVAGVSKNRDGFVDRLDYACSHPRFGLARHAPERWLQAGHPGRPVVQRGSRLAALAGLRERGSQPDRRPHQRQLRGRSRSAAACRADDRPDRCPLHPGERRAAGLPLRAKWTFQLRSERPQPEIHQLRDFERQPAPTTQRPAKPVNIPPVQQLDQHGLSAAVDWKLGENYSLKSVTAWREYDSTWASDADNSPLPSQQLLQTLKHWQKSQELRLNGQALNDRVDFTVGAFWFKQGGTLQARVDLNYSGIDFIHGPDPTPSRSIAGFAHADWHLTEATDLTTGLRYTDDHKSYTFFRRNPDGSDTHAMRGCAQPADDEPELRAHQSV
ncbi:MAG: TonB-dependent receptor [Proteobacteria bacterium]|nr:TonB-dependent receptor [Pseudomonadota bacterium]